MASKKIRVTVQVQVNRPNDWHNSGNSSFDFEVMLGKVLPIVEIQKQIDTAIEDMLEKEAEEAAKASEPAE